MADFKESVSSAGQSFSDFFRANKGLVIGGLTLFVILMVVWARFGFTFEIGRFFAAEPPAFVINSSSPHKHGDRLSVSWSATGAERCDAQGWFETGGATEGTAESAPIDACAANATNQVGVNCTYANGDKGVKTLTFTVNKSTCPGGGGGNPTPTPTPPPGGGGQFPQAAVKPTPTQLRAYAAAQGWSEDFSRFSDAVLRDWIDCCWNVQARKFNSRRQGNPGLWEKPTECPAGMVPGGPNETDPCVPLGGGGGGTPTPPPGGGGGGGGGGGNPTPTPTIPTPGPGEPAAGTLSAVCTGGTTPRITVKWSKSPPPGSTGQLNPGNPAVLNRTVNGAGQQINPQVTDRGSYWEWVDNGTPAVTTGGQVSYTGKYGPNVSTNSVALTASAANCGAATPAPTPTPTTTVGLVCAPQTQTVNVGQIANLQASGAPAGSAYQWDVGSGVVQAGGNETIVVTFSTPGTKVLTVRSGAAPAASCQVIVQGAQMAPYSMVFEGRNASTGGVQGGTVDAQPNQEVEFIATVRNNSSANIVNAVVRATLPSTMAYVVGSSTINGAPTSIDSVTVGGLAIGALGPGQQSVVRFRARASATGFPVGVSQAVVVAQATADAQAAQTGQVTVVVNRQAGSGGSGQVQTGPGDAVLVALLVSAAATLLYVSYTHGPLYRRRELERLGKERDPLDFRS